MDKRNKEFLLYLKKHACMTNYYIVLEIPDFSNESAIKSAYRSLSKKYHPDINNDPYAHEYFLKINEAYDFLINENKRFLLNQFLLVLQNTNKLEHEVQEPIVHSFFTDRKSFVINDYIFIRWHVAHCKEVSINILGAVSQEGSHYLKVDRYTDEILIILTVIGLNDKRYSYEIRLNYFNEHPAVKAYHEMVTKHSETKEINFKEEKFFDTHARLGKNEFVNRMMLLFLILLLNACLYSLVTYKHFMFILLVFNFWFIYVQCYKRLHDTVKLKTAAWKLWIPVYNLFILKELFVLDSEPETNMFGIPPLQSKKSFFNWVFSSIKKTVCQLNLIQKITMSTFIFIFFGIGYKSIRTYDERNVHLTSEYIKTSRPSNNGRVTKEYYLVFDKVLTIEATEIEYEEIVYRKYFDVFKVAVDKNNEVQYVHVIDSKNTKEKRLNYGVLGNANPFLIIIALIFLGQIYVLKNFKKASEIAFVSGYTVFAFFAYLYTLYLILF